MSNYTNLIPKPKIKYECNGFKRNDIVYLIEAKQFGVIQEFRICDGIYQHAKIKFIGSVPIEEIRHATSDECKAWMNRC